MDFFFENYNFLITFKDISKVMTKVIIIKVKNSFQSYFITFLKLSMIKVKLKLC
jgi:hypothetical protein